MRAKEIVECRSVDPARIEALARRCPTCGGRTVMPCKLCATREVVRVKRRMAELRRRDQQLIANG